MVSNSTKQDSHPLRKATYGLPIAGVAGLAGLAVFGTLGEPSLMRISLVVMFVFLALALLSNLIEGITMGLMVLQSIDAEYQTSRIVFIGTLAINPFLFMLFGAFALKFLTALFQYRQG
jgi:hypothetical protein